MAVTSHSTSGSSGTPVSFFVSEMNVLYNETRSTAQYFLEGRDLSHNRTRLRYVPMHDTRQFKVHKTELWQSSLGSLFRCGINKQIEYFNADMKLLTEELERDSIGYLVAVPWTVEAIVQYIDPISLKHAGMTM